MGVKERYEERKKQSATGGVKERHDLQTKSNFSTINTDIEQFNKDYSADYLSNWHSAEDINTYYDRLSSLNDRTKAYQTYVNRYGTDEQKSVLGDIGKQISAYDEMIGKRQDVLDYYGTFKDAEAYSNALAYETEKAAKSKAEQERIASLDIDAARAEIANIDKQVAQYESNKKKVYAVPNANINEVEAYARDMNNRIQALKEQKTSLESDVTAKELYDRNKMYTDILGSSEFASFVPTDDGRYDSVEMANKPVKKRYDNYTSIPEVQYKRNASRRYEHMTDDEYKLYQYLKEAYGQEVARQYAYDLDNELISRQQEEIAGFAESHPVLGTIASLAIAPFQGLEFVGGGLGYALTGDMIQGALTATTSALREGASPDSNFGKFLYNTVTSGVDSVLATALAGKGGGVILGLSAASSTMNDVLARGGTAEQALTSGIASGLFEGFFESFSIGKLKSMKPEEIVKNFKVFAQNALKSVATNASEELATEVANIIFDTSYMGELSNVSMMLDQYRSQGLTEEEAKRKVAHNLGAQVLEAAASGALIGGGMTAIGGGVGLAKVDKARRKLGKSNISGGKTATLIEEATEAFKGEGNAEQQALIKKVEKGLADNKQGRSQQRNIGKLIEAYAEAKYKEQNREIAEQSVENIEKTKKTIENEATKTKVDNTNPTITNDNLPKILGFKEGKLSETVIETENGATAFTEESAANADIGTLYACAIRLGNTQSANNFVQNWDGKTDPFQYYLDFLKFQMRGTYAPDSYDKTMTDYAGVKMSPAAKHAAFQSGISLRESTKEKITKQSEELKGEYEKLGGKAKKGKFNDSKLNYSALTKEQKDVVNFTRILSDYLGVNVEFFVSQKGKRGANGYYKAKNNTIYLDIYAGIGNKESYSAIKDCLINTMSHEIVHNMKVTAPTEYAALRDFIIDKLSKQEGYDLDAKIEQIIAENSDQGFTVEDAIEEIVAMSCEDLLGSSEKLQTTLTEFYAQNEKAANSFNKFVREVLNRLKAFFEKIIGKKSESAESQIMAKQSVEFISELQKRYDVALLAVKEGNAVRNTQNATEGEKVMRQARANTSNYLEYDKPITLKDIEVLRSIGRKSINEFTSKDIEKAQKWAYKFYKEQKLGTKSPFFRAWFGDWREYDDVSRVHTVTVPTIDISQAFLEPGDYKIEDVGWTVHAGKVLNDDTRHHSGGNRINVKSLNAIRDILQNAVLLDTIVSQQDTNKKSANTAFLHKLYTIITYDSKPYIAKITVEEYYNETIKDVSKRAYNLKAIKIEPTGGQLGNDSSSSVPDISSIKSISDLFALVKQYDKEFSPKTSNPLLLDENKEPRVFYHGTNADFWAFDENRIGSGATLFASQGKGFYFTENKQAADKYAKGARVIEAYLSLKKPFVFVDKSNSEANKLLDEFAEQQGREKRLSDFANYANYEQRTGAILSPIVKGDGAAFTKFLEERGYDGIIYTSYNYDESKADLTCIAFHSSQIKSATDNIGTFDSSNPDIRYQKRTENTTNRELLANALESTIDTSTEEGKAQLERLKDYKASVKRIATLEKQRADLVEKGMELMRKKGKSAEENAELKSIWEKTKSLEKRISLHDKELLRLEALKPIQTLLYREKAKAAKKAKKQGTEKQKEIRENYTKREYIKKIEDRVKGFREALTKNSKDKHIPEPFKAVVSDMITALDFSSKRLLEGKAETKKDIKLAKAFRQMANVLNLQNIEGSAGDVQNFLEQCDIDESFIKEFTELSEKINDISDEFGQQSETVLRYMTAEQLRQVNSLLYRLGKQINKVNELIGNNLTRNANDLAIEFINEAEKFTIAKKKNQAIEFLDLKNTTPIYFFKRMGKVGVSIFNEFADGFDRESDLVKQIIDFAEKTYTAKEVKEWSESVHEFTAADGKKLYLTTADMMYFYMLNKRGQGLKHIEGAGVEAEEIKGKAEGDKVKKKYLNDAEGVTISDKTKMDIIGELTPRQIEVADKLQHFMSTTCAAWGNEISMKRFGIKQFLEENYVPIYSSGNTVKKDNSSPATNDTYATLNMSFSQLVDENANNRIMLKNAFDVFADHTTKMAKYNAFAVPLLDIRKFLNYKAKYHTKEDLETDKSFHTKEVLAILDKHYGKEYRAYLDNFIKDIAGEGRTETRGSALLTKFMSKYKVAAVAANLRVALLQGTSYFRVSSVLDEKYLVKEIKDSPQIRRAMRDMEKYSGIAKWKALGYHDVNVTKSVTDKIKHADTWVDKTIEATMKPAELADKITWASIWLACEEEIKDTKKLTRESDEFYNAVALRFREVIYATQVVDSPLAKSDFMRSKDRWDVVFASFMSEPTLSYNLLLDAYHEIADTKRRGEKIKAKNVKRVGRLVIAYVTSSIAQSVVASLVDALRATGDDEDEEYIDSFIENFLGNIVEELSPLYKLPVIKDILGGFHKGLLKKYYSQSRMDIAVFERVGTAINSVWRTIAGKYSTTKLVKDILDAVSSFSGLPLSNVLRDVKSIWGNVMKWFNS